MSNLKALGPEGIVEEIEMDAPLPGESLTQAPGSLPMDRPPQFTDPGQFLDFLFENLAQEQNTRDTLAILRAGVPLDQIVGTTLKSAFGQGLVHPSSMVLATPAFTLMIARMAEAAGVDYKLSSDEGQEDAISDIELLAGGMELENDKVNKAMDVRKKSKDLLNLSPGLMARPEGA
jgi:hypothetical protein